MATRWIDFTPDFCAHLERMGIRIGATGWFEVDETTIVETPINLDGTSIWGAPAMVRAFTYFGPHGAFANAGVGRYCSISGHLQVGMTQHPAHFLTTSPIGYLGEFMNFESHLAEGAPGWRRSLPIAPFEMREATFIGNDVWIGTNVYIKEGVTIGDGAVIGAHSVVTRDVPAYAMVAGSPARMIRYRFPEALVERLLAVAWWDYNILDFAFDIQDPAGCVSALEDEIANGTLLPYEPMPIRLAEEHDRFVAIQDFMNRQRA